MTRSDKTRSGIGIALAIAIPVLFGGAAAGVAGGPNWVAGAPETQIRTDSQDACPNYPSPVICGSESLQIERQAVTHTHI